MPFDSTRHYRVFPEDAIIMCGQCTQSLDFDSFRILYCSKVAVNHDCTSSRRTTKLICCVDTRTDTVLLHDTQQHFYDRT